MLDTGDESPRLTMVFLPAMLCEEELYRPQIEGLRDLVKPVALTVAEPTMAEAANMVLRQAPRRFLLGGTSYGGSLALEVVAKAPSRVLGLWLMGCSPGPHSAPATARPAAIGSPVTRRVWRSSGDRLIDHKRVGGHAVRRRTLRSNGP